jgi:hypothetical protein
MLSNNSPCNIRKEQPFDHLSEYKKSQNCSAIIETKITYYLNSLSRMVAGTGYKLINYVLNRSLIDYT